MKIRRNFLIYPLVLMCGYLVFASSCKKDEVDAPNTFTDSRDGYVYKTVTIGNQEWMAENLKYLPSVVNSATGSSTTPYYYVYGYEGTDVAEAKSNPNYTTYGVLYNWEAAKAACPNGWHLASDAEWEMLANYLADNGYNYDGSTGGGRDKIAKSLASTNYWQSSSNTGAVGNADYPDYRNKSGFTGLPSGYRELNGGFYFLGSLEYWWNGTEASTGSAWYQYLNFGHSHLNRATNNKEYGFSARCIRN